MKVKISYTIDFESVPEKVAQLLKEHSSTLSDCQKNLEKVIDDIDEDKNISVIVDNIDLLRKGMLDVDTALMDCHSLMAGYLQTKASMTMQTVEQPIAGGPDESGDQG